MSNENKQPSRSADDDDEGIGLDKKLASQSVQFVDRLLRLCNSLNAGLLFTAGILALILESFNLPLVITAIYVMIFSSCLCIFELRWRTFERIAFRYFGFMFGWWGRCMFFIFVGTLCIGFGTVLGYVAASLTGVNVFWNYYCLRVHGEYAKWVRDDFAMRRARAAAKAEREANRAVTELTKKNATNYTPETAFPEIKVGVKAAGIEVPVVITTNNGKDEWEKLYDENTKQYYYHNHATGETRWDVPK